MNFLCYFSLPNLAHILIKWCMFLSQGIQFLSLTLKWVFKIRSSILKEAIILINWFMISLHFVDFVVFCAEAHEHRKLFNKFSYSKYFRILLPPYINVLICLSLLQRAYKAIWKICKYSIGFCLFFLNITGKNKTCPTYTYCPYFWRKRKLHRSLLKMLSELWIIENSHKKRNKGKSYS